MKLILASTSPYRRELLERLGIPFTCQDPEVDETPLAGEAPEDTAARLAMAKALSISATDDNALVIGSDQVASINGRVHPKPGNHERAREQLSYSSGKTVHFHTGLAVVNSSTGLRRLTVEHTSVTFRTLSERTIERYLAIERPYDCAGSFKCEGLGIILFQAITGTDPTSLQGLPLIALTSLLIEHGVYLPL